MSISSETDGNNGFNYDYMNNTYFYGPYNHVRDFDKVQGMTHASDQHIQPIRDINYRYISVQNSGQRPVGIAIRTYGANYANGLPSGGVTFQRYNGCGPNTFGPDEFRRPIGCGLSDGIGNNNPLAYGCGSSPSDSCQFTNFTPKIDFILGGGQIKNLNINTVGGPTQYIYALNPENGLRVGSMTAIDRNVNQFVYRDGLNGGFFQKFHQVGYKG